MSHFLRWAASLLALISLAKTLISSWGVGVGVGVGSKNVRRSAPGDCGSLVTPPQHARPNAAAAGACPLAQAHLHRELAIAVDVGSADVPSQALGQPGVHLAALQQLIHLHRAAEGWQRAAEARVAVAARWVAGRGSARVHVCARLQALRQSQPALGAP